MFAVIKVRKILVATRVMFRVLIKKREILVVTRILFRVLIIIIKANTIKGKIKWKVKNRFNVGLLFQYFAM